MFPKILESVGISSIRYWVHNCASVGGQTTSADEKRCDWTVTAVTPCNVYRVHAVIRGDTELQLADSPSMWQLQIKCATTKKKSVEALLFGWLSCKKLHFSKYPIL